MNDKSKNVLIVSYSFLPNINVGVRRIRNFVKYLPLYGVNPIILTTKNKLKGFTTDGQEIHEGINVKVYRTNTFAPFVKAFYIKRNVDEKKVIKKNLLYKVISTLIDLCRILLSPVIFILTFPDPYIFWFPFAIYKSKKIFKENRIDVVFVTGRPFSTFLIGCALKFICHIPLVIDFRDPWTENEVYYNKRPLSKYFTEKLESNIMKYADSIIFIGEFIRNSYLKKYKFLNSRKVFVITNSYDNEDFDNIKPFKYNKFTIIHAGNLYYTERNPYYFFVALKELLEEGLLCEENIQILFYGDFNPEFVLKSKELYLDKIVFFKDRVSRKEIISYMKGANILLLIEGFKFAITAKIFEYLAIGNPILALVPEISDVVSILNSTQSGAFAVIDNVKSIKDSLLKLYWNKAIFNPDINEVSKYSSLFKTKELVSIFLNVIKKVRSNE